MPEDVVRRLAVAGRILAATFALLLATACGGGWGSLGGQPPTITKQPANQTVGTGQTATFTVTAAGTGTLNYQWYKNGTAISGATSTSYTTPAATSTDTGSIYTVTVTDSGGTVTSTPATLTVTVASTTLTPNPPVITSQPVSQTITVGQIATFNVTATGDPILTYQWYKGAVLIPGATSASYTTSVSFIGDNGSLFTVTVTNPAGSATSIPADLTVNATTPGLPTITTQPVSQTVNTGQPVTFTVVAAGSGTLTYQWYDNGTPVPGATSSTYTDPTTAGTDSGSHFTVTVTNPTGTVTSTAATLTVNTPPTITTPPANQVVNAGQTGTFSVVAAGTAPLTYQWYKGGVLIPGATATSYTTAATSTGDSGSLFTVIVTNSAGTATGGPASLTVNSGPTITTQPTNQTVNSGQSATFIVVASGTSPLSYQWYDNGVPIPGATSSTYTTATTSSTDNGSHITVTVTNPAGTATSNPATLTVNTAPTITTPPTNQTVNVGQTGTFSVVAAGTAPLTYQWYKDGSLIPGATGTSYTTPATVSGDTGSLFTLIVTNSAGSATGGPAALTVNAGPTITTPPANQAVNVGQTGTFSVAATGSGTLTYQWYKGGVLIPGATGTSYTTPATVIGDSGSLFTVTVTNSVGSATGGPATLTVNTTLSITTPPANQTVNVGQTATFSVAATGSGTLTYQWYQGGVLIPGATGTSYTIPATVSGDTGSLFTVTVKNAAETATSGPASLTVNVGPTITSQPANQTVNAGQTATFSVAAAGSGTLTYQWYKGGTLIPGATATSYTTPATASSDTGSLFSVAVTNPVGSATGGPASLTVNVGPTITSQPANQTVNVGQTATFTVAATGSGTLTYQWYKGGTLIPGATATSYTTPATASSDNNSLFTVTVTNSVGSATGGPATLTVNVGPAITTPPANQNVNVGQTAAFTVAATGSGTLTYQWYKGGTLISGATATSYTTPATASSDNNSLFTVTVTNSVGSATGGPATLTVNTDPLIVSPPANQTVNVGQTATFSVSASGTTPLSYQWYKNGTLIPGATASTYTTPATVSGDNGAHFTVTVTNPVSSATTNPATLTVNVGPTITTQPLSQTITTGQTATFTVAATGTAPLSYQWYKGGVLISGATGASYTTPVTSSAGTSQYTVIVTNVVTSVTSDTATLTVQNGTPLATLLSCNSITPPYNGTATIIPTFSGGTAVIGSTGLNSSNITAAAVNGSSYTSLPATSAETYTLTVTGSGGATAFTTCTVVPTGVTISAITPANQTMAPGTQAFNATATGGATDTLTWTATGGTFAGNVWTSSNTAGTYTITATSVDKPSISVTTTAIVTAPVIVTQPVNQNVCTNTTATLSVVANYAVSYQWNLGGTALAGATSTGYYISSAIAMDAGDYTVTVTNPAGSIISNIAKVVVGSSITTNPVSLSILSNQTATFSVAATGSAPFNYQWYDNGAPILGATSSTYTTPAESTSATGSQFYVTVTDACGGSALTSTSATLTVTGGDSPPTITTQPVSQTVVAGSVNSAMFTVVAAGSPTLKYQWYRIPAGSTTGVAINSATSASYTVSPSKTTVANDQDGYYVIVTNNYGQAVSQTAILAVGSGILITKQPASVYVSAGYPATFSVTATSALTLSYQWYEAPPRSSTFTAISGATSSSYTQASTAATDTGSVFYVVVSNGSTASVTSSSAGLFVGALSPVSNLCSWTTNGNAQSPTASCSIRLVAATTQQQGAIVWPTLVSTGNIQLSFTVTTSEAGSPPADGFALVLGDPSLGATPTSIGLPGEGLGAQGIPGVVLAFDDYDDPGDASVPYLAIEWGESALWENPYLNLNTNIPALATTGSTVTHNYTVSLAEGIMTVTMDGTQVFSGTVSVPPVAYLYFTASTGADYEQTVISNLSATVSAPSN